MKSIVIAVVFGVMLGVGGAALDTVFDLSFTNVNLATVIVGGAWFLLNSGVVWGLLAFVVGRLSRKPLLGIAAGVVSLLAAVGSYYVYGVTLGDRIWGFGPLIPVIAQWTIAALFFGALLGVLGVLSRSTSRFAYLGIITPTVLAIGALFLGLRSYSFFGVTFGANVLVVAACAVAGAVMVWRRVRLNATPTSPGRSR
ncbi:MAG: hypothetical protein ACOH1T_10075 [Microbacteriaceae bacterium]